MLQPYLLFELYDSKSEEDFQDVAEYIFKNNCSYNMDDFEEEITKRGYEKLIYIIDAIIIRFSEYDLLNDNSIKELENKLKWLKRSLEKDYKLSLAERIMKQSFDKIIFRSMTVPDFDNLREDLMKANYLYTKPYDYVLEEVNFVNRLNSYYDELTISELENIYNRFKFIFDEFYHYIQNDSNNTFNICLKRALRIYIDLIKTSYRERLKKRRDQVKEEQEKRRQYEKAIRITKNVIGQEMLPFYHVEDALKRTIAKRIPSPPEKNGDSWQQLSLRVDIDGNIYYE